MFENFAAYLAKMLIVRKGFASGALPAAKPLADMCDFVLFNTHNFRLEIVGIVDAEALRDKRLRLTVEEVQRIAAECGQPFSDGRSKPFVDISIIETGFGPMDGVQKNALQAFGQKPAQKDVSVKFAYIDLQNKTVDMSCPFNGLLRGRLFLESLLHEPRLTDSDMEKERSVAIAAWKDATKPYLTVALLFAMILAFAAKFLIALYFPKDFLEPGARALLLMGADNREMVFEAGQYYRLLLSAFLHGSASHLLMNIVSLFLAGRLVEKIAGRWWLAALFCLSAVGASLASLFAHSSASVSCGASGASLGLLAAAFLFSFRLSPTRGRRLVQMMSLGFMLPSLIPVIAQIDYPAHLGGLLTGGLVAWGIMVAFWPKDSSTPKGQLLAACVTLAGGATLLYGLYSTVVLLGAHS